MSASQESQPTLDSVAPRFLVGDMEQALAFYGQLGFATTYHDGGLPLSNVMGSLCTSMSPIQHKSHQRVAQCVGLASSISRRCISSICQLALFNLLSTLCLGG